MFPQHLGGEDHVGDPHGVGQCKVDNLRLERRRQDHVDKSGEKLQDDNATIAAFVEKPDTAKAQQYLDSGDYLWNSGMFMMTAKNWLTAIRELQPEMAECVEQAWQQGERDRDFFRIGEESFSKCPADSIDYAVMENTQRAAMVPAVMGWSDIGNWASLQDALTLVDDGTYATSFTVIEGAFDLNGNNPLVFAKADHLLQQIFLEDCADGEA